MPRSLELFTSLRIIEPVLKKAILTPPVRIYSTVDGKTILQEFEMCPYQKPSPTHPFLNPVMLGQDSLEKILHAALAEHDCSVELGTELVTFEQEESSVTVNLVKRGLSQEASDGVNENATYKWVIGCDGARGVVRKQLGLPFVGETRNVENFIVGDISVQGLARNCWHMWGDASDVLISLRATETTDLYNFLVGGKNIRYAELANNHEALKACFVQHTGRRQDLLFGTISWISTYTPNIRMVERFGRGRVFVVGDAGHVHSPTGGQGMNTSIQDAFNLGWKLALVVKGIAKHALLDTYTEERIPVIAEMISQTTELLNRTLNNDNTAWKTDSNLYQLGVNYRWSSIVLEGWDTPETRTQAGKSSSFELIQEYDPLGDDDRDPENVDSYGLQAKARDQLRPGDRAPDAPGLLVQLSSSLLQQRCQLFQLFDAVRHTILVFLECADLRPIIEALDAYPRSLWRAVVILRPGASSLSPRDALMDFVVEDSQGHAHTAYSPKSGYGVCIVRPDGILGATVKDSSSVRQYFNNVFSALIV
ncbi:pentachlorophenol 4-monooxygenase [Crepidotus variabilis]|uniref:Pentachlorophenol 4-monooxygenase n=1 Tax=Crepidotus variabilis TaxID=179855 RepID=A0A9P6JSB4_9AGAR|nr:pentachlorophenol 4-monooxygenase [Crepidotus variabilis]